MMICLSIRPTTMPEALRRLREVPRGTDLVEVRIDSLEDLDLARLLAKPRPKVIITNRRRDEGGSFEGTGARQLELLGEAAARGAEFVDIEMQWGRPVVKALVEGAGATRVICSHHNFQRTPATLIRTYEGMRSTGAHVLKIVTTALDICDNRVMFDLLRRARRERQPLIAFSMGEKGEIGRILGGAQGSFLGYAARTPAECTAPGQLTFEAMTRLFRAGRLDRRTKVFGLIGNPVRQSRGIFYHNRAFIRNGRNAVYVNLLVDDLDRFLHEFGDFFAGYSVTMPFKKEIVSHLDRIDPVARALGVVNTVIRRKGALAGTNTDLPAVSALLKQKINLRGKRVLVLGSGATARTMACAALAGGARPTIVGRNSEKTELAARDIGSEWGTFDRLSDQNFDVIMNGTPVGMRSPGVADANRSLLVPPSLLRPGTVVFDAVYDPPITPLLRAAQRRQCRVITGKQLYLRQALLQSRMFLDSC